jgi:ribonucleoside-diphosphate reductase alpha chain
MATSVIDYIFRDLAISYLKRIDLGQVKPEDLVATGTKGDSDAMDPKPRHGEKHSPAGFKPHGSALAAPVAPPPPAVAGKPVAKPQTGGPGSGVKPPSASTVSPPPIALAAQPVTQTQVRVLEQTPPQESEVIKIVQARIKGYEGDPCSSCGSFTLVRNGTCMKCDTCGGTTGCS